MAVVYPGGTGITDKAAADLESGGMKFVGTHPTVADPWETDYSDIRDAITANPGGAIGSGTAATGLTVSTGIIIKCEVDDVSNPPTDAEIDAAIGTPVAMGAGYMFLLDDAAGGANFYLIASDGTNWWSFTGTKLT